MQKAIENYIEKESKKNVPLDDIGIEIDRISDAEIQEARKKQYKEWRKLNK